MLCIKSVAINVQLDYEDNIFKRHYSYIVGDKHANPICIINYYYNVNMFGNQ